MRISAIGFNQLHKRLTLHALGYNALRDYMNDYGELIVQEAKKHVPEDSGRLKNSLRHKTIGGLGAVPKGVDVFSTESYAPYVHGYPHEHQRLSEPWTRSKPHFPPVEAIRPWATKRGLNPFAVAKGIAKKGTPLVPFFKIAVRETVDERNALLRETGFKITAMWKAGRRKVRG